MKKLILIPMLASLMLFSACGSSSSNTPTGTGQGNFSNASLKGSYAYQISGTDLANNVPYREAGVFSADGNGNITSGTDDFAESSGPLNSNPITGTYSVANDGTGSISLAFPNGSLNFSITLVTASQFYLTEADSGAIGAGSGLLQNSSVLSSTPSGNFVFRVHTNSTAQGSSSLVGAFIVSGGVIAGSDDALRGAILDNNTGAALTVTGNINTPNSSGRGTASITDSSGITNNFVYYVVDANNLILMESDTGVIGIGNAQSQSAGPYSNASLNGSYAFGSRADDNSALNAVKTVGVFSAGGNGSITGGTLDAVVDGTNYAAVPLSGTYTVASNGRAVVSTNNQALGAVQQIFWMVSPSRIYFLTADSTKVEDGTIDKQTTGSFGNASLNGQYAFFMEGFNYSPLYLTRIGWISWNGSGSLTWNEAVNDSSVGYHTPGFLTGSYAVSSNGRATATVNNLSVNQNDLVFYMVSTSQAYCLQNDSGYEISGAMALQP